MKVQCPICKKPVIWEETSTRPFCSERCRILDLGDWAQEKYAVPDAHSTEEPVSSTSEDSDEKSKNHDQD